MSVPQGGDVGRTRLRESRRDLVIFRKVGARYGLKGIGAWLR
jgi:hypothetical protein